MLRTEFANQPAEIPEAGLTTDTPPLHAPAAFAHLHGLDANGRSPQALAVALGLLQASPTPMLLWWADETLPRTRNAAYEQLLDQPGQAMTPQAWTESDWAAMQADVAEVRRTGRTVWRQNLPMPLPHTPTGEFCGTYSYNPIVDERGVAGVLFVCSRHYRSSTVHEDGRFGYAALIHSMDLGFAIVEALETPPDQLLDYRFIEVNRSWEKQTGFAPVQGKRVTELVQMREPFWPHLIARVLHTGVAERGTTYHHGWDRTVDVFAMRLGGDSSRQVALLVRDVSAEARALQALQKSEQRARAEAERAEAERHRLDAVLEAIPAPVFVVDAQGQFIRANSRARSEWGSHLAGARNHWMGWWADGSQRHGRRVQPEEWPLARALRGQTCHDILEIALPTDAAQRRIYLVSGAPIFGPDGGLEGAVVTATDISAQVQAERDLQESNQRKDEFLAMLAHELRNPLAPIGAAAELMSRPRADKTLMARTSAIIARQVRHMTGLVDDLLDMSRVSRGTITLDTELLDTESVTRDALEQVAPLLRDKRHRLEIDAPRDPVSFEGDRKRVIQVLSNLLNNAIKYTPDSGHVRLSVARVDTRVEFRVKDNGVGMDGATLAHAFELFAQARRSSDRQQGGLGIGLALVKKLVELHGGEVTAVSQGLGQGSEFILRLPAHAQAVAPAGEEPAPVGKAARPLRVLVVDDHVDGALTLSMLVEAEGHTCDVAHAPERALALAACCAPDVCVLDIGLPGMDGRELARRLRQQPAMAGALLIALTGYAQARDREAALAAGFDHYLVKPVDSSELLQLLSQHASALGRASGPACGPQQT